MDTKLNLSLFNKMLPTQFCCEARVLDAWLQSASYSNSKSSPGSVGQPSRQLKVIKVENINFGQQLIYNDFVTFRKLT